MFITVEGGEGAGKTTLIERLKAHLEAQGEQVITTREPGGCTLAEQIRTVILSNTRKIDPVAETLLFLTARSEHIAEIIRPALDAGKTVICDRFNDSTIAYQGFARGLGLEKVEALCNAIPGNLTPDITFFLDIDPVEGLKRRRNLPDELDRIESEAIAFHRKVREGFLILAKSHPRIHIIDATQSIDDVFSEALLQLTSIA